MNLLHLLQRYSPLVTLIASFLVIAGAITALIGIYWDEAWHTDYGRDTFWSAPHVVLYGGVAMVGGAMGLWTLLALAQTRSVRATLRQTPLVLGLVGMAITLASAPLDDFWHVTFGRDAVLWSPPHLLGLAGILALVGGVLLELSSRNDAVCRRVFAFGTAALLAALVVLIFEYDADVPQFAAFWYLPILSGASALAFGLSRGLARDRWSATVAALMYTALMGAVSVFLFALGHSRPIMPALLVPALVFDLAAQRRWPRSLWATAFAVALFAAYVPYLNLMLGGVQIGWTDLLAGVPLALAVTWAVLAATGLGRPVVARAPAAALAALALVAAPSPALAHDPGQGFELAPVLITATSITGVTTVTAEITETSACTAFAPIQLTARRAGEAVHAALKQIGSCQYEGTITLPERGRWFVYVESAHGEAMGEAWLPVVVSDRGRNETVQRDTMLYVPPQQSGSTLQIAAGILLYAFNLSVVVLVIVLFRRQARVMPAAAI